MARVTVEDCVLRVPNRFELVMVAAQRARNITSGAPLTVDLDNDKMPVVALREIADSTVDLKELEESLVKGLQRFHETEEEAEPELDTDEDILAAEAIEVVAAGSGFGIVDEEESGEEDFDAGDTAAEMDEAGDPMADLELGKEGEDVFSYEDVADPED